MVRTMEVLAEPLLEVAREGFTKEVVKLENGDLNRLPQLSVRIKALLMAVEKDGVVHVAVVYDATCVCLPLNPGSLTTVAHTTHRLLGSKLVVVVIRMCLADSDMIHRLVTIGYGNGPPTECWATHDISKNQWDNEPVDRPLCGYLQRKAAVKKPTTAHVPLRYKACKGQEWVGQGPMIALAAAQLEHIAPDVTHPPKWEKTASRVYVPMGSPGPAISTSPAELSMEVPAAPNQSWNNYNVAGYHLMQALFPPEIHKQLQNIVNPDRQTLEEWPVHGAGYPGLRLQTHRDAVTWFPLPLQNALYNAIYEQWIFLKDSNTLGTILDTRPEDTNTEDWAGYELLHRMHHWSHAYAHVTHTVIVPLQDVEAAQAL